jgi:hypothetical protein
MQILKDPALVPYIVNDTPRVTPNNASTYFDTTDVFRLTEVTFREYGPSNNDLTEGEIEFTLFGQTNLKAEPVRRKYKTKLKNIRYEINSSNPLFNTLIIEFEEDREFKVKISYVPSADFSGKGQEVPSKGKDSNYGSTHARVVDTRLRTKNGQSSI